MRNQSGFTLIELVTVIAIIIFLAGITIGVGKYMVDRSASKAAQAQLATLNRALDRYAADNMRYPDKHPSLVNLFPPDTDPATFTALYGLPLSRISSQYTNGKLEYYKASVSEVDVNGDGEVTIEDRFEDELFILDPWGLPIFYYVEERRVLERQVYFEIGRAHV